VSCRALVWIQPLTNINSLLQHGASYACGVEMSYTLELAKLLALAKHSMNSKDASRVARRKMTWFSPHGHGYATAVFAALCVLTVGCVTTPKRPASSLVVPSRCLKMTAESFTRPCAQRADGKLVCDGVIVTATCVEVANK